MNKKVLCLCLSIIQVNGFTKEKQVVTHDFTLSGEVLDYRYKEPDLAQHNDGNKIWMDQKGVIFGIHGSHRLTYQDKVFIQSEGRIFLGREAYRQGDNQGVGIKTDRNTPNLIAEPRLLVGGNIATSQFLTVSPYTGIGYRLKIDDSEKTILRSKYPVSDGRISGWYRKSNYVYVPLGAEVRYQVCDVWSVSARGEYDYLIKGWQYSRSEKHVQPNRTVTDEQKGTHGWKGEISIGYQLDKVKLSLTPYCYYWHIGNSNWRNGGREPYNRTIETGLRFGVTF